MKTILIDKEQWAEETFICEVEKNNKIDFIKRFYDLSTAIKFIKENPVDLIFVDFEMSEINCNSFLRKVKAINPNIGVIFMTVNEECIDNYENLNFIVKPYNNEDIENILMEETI